MIDYTTAWQVLASMVVVQWQPTATQTDTVG